jgi:dTDP-4-dehydrorhamnose 3,5-epimerase
MEMTPLRLQGLKLITPLVFFDKRGFFKETYNGPRYTDLGVSTTFVQDNHSFSQKNVLRGMHFQTTPGQDKLVWVTQGKIFDVAVDLRKDSPTFGQWEGVYLDGESHQQFFIPNGFAHGFYVMSEEGAHVNYKVSAPYNGATEKSFRYDDPTINIAWPAGTPIISTRDLEAPSFLEALK